MGRLSKAKMRSRKNLANAQLTYSSGSMFASLRANRAGSDKKTMDLLKKIRKYKARPTYSLVDKGSEIRAIIVGLIHNDLPVMQCNHLRIGSSLVAQLLASNVTFQESHRFYKTKSDRHFGGVLEYEVSLLLNETKNKICHAPWRLPFLCATPDFVLKDRLVEVKSHRNKTNVSKADILQLLMAMEIFEKDTGEVRMYLMRTEKNPYKPIPHEIIGIKKRVSLFTDSFVHHACQGYISYLSTMLGAIGIYPTPAAMAEGLSLLLANFKTAGPGSVQIPGSASSKFCCDVLCKVKARKPGNPTTKGDYLWDKAVPNFNHFRIKDAKYREEAYEAALKAHKSTETFPRIFSNYLRRPGKVRVTYGALEKRFCILTNKRSDTEPEIIIEKPLRKPTQIVFVIDEESVDTLLRSFGTLGRSGHLISQYPFLPV